ncbi:hypothetical protein EHS25_000647 [Saitozyma podzolica]|uniref:Uncharacterized protein n=1 Tax=Saitozyma podzolica TaxID=1890683 RepID=A0A427YWY7_9TREE|nr:hypothetical protein EHS25_000647 [Saitozyma podzolica]
MPSRSETNSPTNTNAAGDLCREQGGVAVLAYPRADKGRHRVLQAGQSPVRRLRASPTLRSLPLYSCARWSVNVKPIAPVAVRQTSLGNPEVCLQRKPWAVAPHEGAKHIFGQALTSTHHQSQTRTPRPPDQHHTTGLTNADYDLTVVFLLASKDSRTTSLPEQISRLRARPQGPPSPHQQPPVPPHCALAWWYNERRQDQGLCLLETGNDTRDIQPDAQTAEPLPFAGEGPQL